jgi:hypothetical protein
MTNLKGKTMGCPTGNWKTNPSKRFLATAMELPALIVIKRRCDRTPVYQVISG